MMETKIVFMSIDDKGAVANITAEAENLPEKTLNFKVRIDKGRSYLTAPMPKDYIEKGASTSMTFALKDVEVNHPYIKMTTKRATSNIGGSKKNGRVLPTLLDVDDEGNLSIYKMEKDGTKSHPITIQDETTKQAFKLVEAFNHYKTRLLKSYETSTLATNSTIRDEMKALLISTGMSPEDADKAIAKKYDLETFSLAKEEALMASEAAKLVEAKAK